jgi:hypothetical protein
MSLADIRTKKLCFVYCGERCDCESGRPVLSDGAIYAALSRKGMTEEERKSLDADIARRLANIETE